MIWYRKLALVGLVRIGRSVVMFGGAGGRYEADEVVVVTAVAVAEAIGVRCAILFRREQYKGPDTAIL